MNNIDEMIKILTAFKQGKEIEYRQKDFFNKWHISKEPSFNFGIFDYRIKQIQKFFYHNIYFNEKTGLPELGTAHLNAKEAKWAKNSCKISGLTYLKTIKLLSGKKYKIFN